MLAAIAHVPAAVIQTAETIARNGAALTRLVDDLLDVSRISLGGVRLEWQSTDLVALVEAAVGGIRPAAEAKGIRLTVRSDPRVARIMADPTRLQQVTLNLLTNAMKFTPRGGEIRAAVQDDGAHVTLRVSDTGQGIDPSFLPFVFEMFRQGEPSNNRTHGGLGIGLSIVRRLVELHGGTVSAASPGVGRGSTLTVSFPYQPAGPSRAQAGVQQHVLDGGVLGG